MWERNYRPANEQAGSVVYQQLSRALRDEGIAAALGKLDQGEVQKLRDDALLKVARIVERLDPLLESWRRADAKLESAEDHVERSSAAMGLNWIVPGGGILAAAIASASLILASLFDFAYLRQGLIVAAVAAVAAIAGLQIVNYHRRQVSWFDRRQARKAAERRFEFAATNLATIVTREAINERLLSFSTGFRVLDQRGLRSLDDPEREVSTTASEELTTLVTSLAGGSIGLSGPRGSGKTTLVNSFARGRSVPFERERVGVVVSAPVKYDAKEFVLHLFASLCESVIGESRLDSLISAGPAALRSRREVWFSRLLELTGLLAIAAGAALLIFGRITPEEPVETGTVLVVLGGLLVLAGSFLSLRPHWPSMKRDLFSAFSSEEPAPPRKTPERTARDCLEQIRFQQSISSGLSGSLKLPLGVSAGRESTVTSARTPWSLPEAVEAFRMYAESLTADRYLVIGIDELDKMGSDDTAREFLNNVKGVFGVSGCYYLVSVSDDAMASFERRGLPVRDVFDSSFDAILRVGYLTLEESRTVLGGRVIGLPVPYQCLCHCLAGGLPRDLIRVTRELVHQAEKSGATSLDALANAVVAAELRAKTAGAVEESRGLEGSDGKWVQRWLDAQRSAPATADVLEGTVAGLKKWGGLQREGPELTFEVAAFNFYAATALELFDDRSQFIGDLGTPEGDPTAIDPSAAVIIETLARARQQFAISPDLAWESVATVRDELSLPPWEDPRKRRGAPVGRSSEAAPS